MNKKTYLSLAIILFLALTAYKIADDILTRLGMQQQYAQRMILNNLVGSFSTEPIDVSRIEYMGNDVEAESRGFQIPYIQKTKMASLLSGDKSSAARELCEYVKIFVSSKEFIEQYNKARETAKPTGEPFRMDAATIDMMKKSVKDMEAQLPALKKNKSIPASTIVQYEKSIAEQKKNIAEQSDPTPNKTLWEKSFPADPAVLIKKRLEEYLTLAASVDFKAQLTEPDKYRKVKFVNAAYEKKSLKWKAIFRAGKEVNEVTTAFVKEWIKEGIKLNSTSMPAEKPASASKETKTNPLSDPAKNENSNDASTDEKPKKGLLNKLKNKAKSIGN